MLENACYPEGREEYQPEGRQLPWKNSMCFLKSATVVVMLRNAHQPEEDQLEEDQTEEYRPEGHQHRPEEGNLPEENLPEELRIQPE